ncbi:hypothetical protein HispidOSU_004524 [Sigmodon hispidus]
MAAPGVGSHRGAARRSLRYPGCRSAEHSKNTLGGTHSRKHKAGQKHKPKSVFDFPDNSDISSMLQEMEEEEEPYETFDPPLHSTAIYGEEELSQSCLAAASPVAHGREEDRSLNPSENEASVSKSTESSAKQPRRMPKPISSESESSEDDVRKKVGSRGSTGTQPHRAPSVASSVSSGKPAERITPDRKRPRSTQSAAEQSQLEEERQSPDRRKKPARRGAEDSDTDDSSECMHIWCPERKRLGDIMELDVILSAFEKTFLEYKQRIESERCNQAINTFYYKIKGELIRMLKEILMLKTLKRKNAKIISNMEKKRQRLIEVQDELLRLEPQLKQEQRKYYGLKERKSSLKNSMDFLSNLKQLHQDYLNIQENEPKQNEKYDSSSLPALLFKARTILGAKTHLKTINYQLGKLLEQE